MMKRILLKSIISYILIAFLKENKFTYIFAFPSFYHLEDLNINSGSVDY